MDSARLSAALRLGPSSAWASGPSARTIGHSSCAVALLLVPDGVCDPCDAEGGRHDIREANLRIVREAYDNHLQTVRTYFSSNEQRARRIHYMDYENDPLAGRKVCEFMFEAGDARCANLTAVPNVEPWDMPDKMRAEAEMYLDDA